MARGWEANKNMYERRKTQPSYTAPVMRTPRQFAARPMKHVDEYPVWPFIAIMALAICWVVSLTTSFTFSDSLLVGAVIVLVPLVSRGLRKARNRDAEEIAEKMAGESGQQAGTGTEEDPAWQNNTMKNGN